MLLKSADDKDPQLKILNNLLTHEKVPTQIKQKIEVERRNLITGVETEQRAAYEIDFYFARSKNLFVLHDLRLEINGRVAQIDHVLMNRGLDVFVLETKTFNTGLTINERGEFSTMIEGRPTGIASPIEQNARHIAVLKDAFAAIVLPRRLGLPMRPVFHSVVLVSQQAVINRPVSAPLNATIIKLDQFFSWYNKGLDTLTASDCINVFKVVSKDTVNSLGEKLCGMHKPGRIDYVRKYNLAEYLTAKQSAKTPTPDILTTLDLPDPQPSAQTACFYSQCSVKISAAVAKFCSNNKKRFGGHAYCMPCQGKFQPVS